MAKKQKTPEQVKRRFVIAVTLIGFMVVYTIGTNYRARHTPSEATQADTVLVLNHQLDSLLQADYADTEVASVGQYGYVSRRKDAELELELLEKMLSDNTPWSEKILERNRARASELREMLDTLPAGNDAIKRGVTVTDHAAGRTLYGEQATDLQLLLSTLFVRYTEPIGYGDKSKSEETEKEMTNNN